MYVLKNAIKNIWRNRGRNILVGIIIFGIILSTVVSFGINSTGSSIIKDYKSRFGSEVSITLDMEKLMSQQGNSGTFEIGNSIDADKYISFANSKYLQKSYLKSEVPIVSDKIKAIDEDESKNQFDMQNIIMAGSGDEEDVNEFKMPTFRILGNSSTDSLKEFKENERKIVEGKIYKNKNECIISKELAKLNNIKVGDEIEFKDSNDYKNKIKLKVTGIYNDLTSEYGNMPFKDPYMNRRNEILTNFETCKSNVDTEYLMVDAKYYLKDPDMLEDFNKEVKSKGLSDDYKVSTDESTYNSIVKPVEALTDITKIFVIVVIILGGIILILLNNISIRERKYEIGVLRAMGMKKGKVALGLITESIIITSICLVIGIGAGSLIVQPVCDSLLQKQADIQKENNENQAFMMGGASVNSTIIAEEGVIPVEESISEIEVKIDNLTIIKTAGVSLILIILSSSMGVIYITKYEPRKILTERG